MGGHKENKIYATAIIMGILLLVLGAILFYLAEGEGKSLGSWGLATFGVLGLIALFGVISAITMWKKKEKHETDYYAFFTMGITFLPLGIIFQNYVFFTMGLVFMGVGLANKDKWKKKKWSDLDPQQKNLKIVAMVVLGILVLAGLGAYYLTAK